MCFAMYAQTVVVGTSDGGHLADVFLGVLGMSLYNLREYGET